MSAEDQIVNDRPGPQASCPNEVNGVAHGSVTTFIGTHYLVTNEWEAVCCTKCQRFLRWATNAESVINTAKRALGATEPVIP